MEALDNEKDLNILALELAQRIYDGEDITADDDLLRLTAQQLLEGVHQGLDINLNAIDFSSPDFDTLAKLTENVYHFSAAKNYHELHDLSLALRDGDKIRSFEDFKTKAEEISGKYNVSWLRSEYNQAIAASQSAAHWNSFYKDKDLMPYLQYQADRKNHNQSRTEPHQRGSVFFVGNKNGHSSLLITTPPANVRGENARMKQQIE